MRDLKYRDTDGMKVDLSLSLSLCLWFYYFCVFLFVSSFLIPVCYLSLISYLNFHNIYCLFLSLIYQLYVSSIFINSSLTRFTKLILCCLSRPRFWAFHFLYLIIFSFKTFLIKKVRNKLRLKHQWICKNKCFHPILKFQQFSDVCFVSTYGKYLLFEVINPVIYISM